MVHALQAYVAPNSYSQVAENLEAFFMCADG